MIGLLEDLVDLIGNIPDYFLYAMETVANLFFSAVSVLFTAISIISLPSIPTVPEYISSINWFFPLGAVIAVMSPLVIGYTAFLLVRWIYKKTGNL